MKTETVTQFFIRISMWKFNENLSGGSRVVSMLTNGRKGGSTCMALAPENEAVKKEEESIYEVSLPRRGRLICGLLC
jgi:hypothetical protein